MEMRPLESDDEDDEDVTMFNRKNWRPQNVTMWFAWQNQTNLYVTSHMFHS